MRVVPKHETDARYGRMMDKRTRTPRPDVAAELLESWINGNRTWVREQLAKKRGAARVRIFATMLEYAADARDDVRGDLIRAFGRD